MSSSKLALDSLLKQQKSDAYADVISGVLEKAHWNTPANDKQHRIQQLTTFTSQGNKDTLNNASRYQDFWVDNPKRTFFRLANWASGMGNLCRILTKYDLEACKTLFCTYADVLKKKWGQRYTIEQVFARNNLFHGHLGYNEAHKSFLLVFHACEYPKNLEENKSINAKAIEDWAADACERNSYFESITNESSIYPFRNAVYSFSANRMWVLNYTRLVNHPYRHLLANPNDETNNPITADESLVTDEQLGNVNYFPNEYDSRFLTGLIG